MIELTNEQIDNALPRIEDGLLKYLDLQKELKNVDVSRNRDFQRRFNHFYKVRRNADWQTQYYKLLEEYKNSHATFSEILCKIHENTGRYEASFASKLVASIDAEQPIIDKFVLMNVGLRLPYSKAKNRASKIVEVHIVLLSKLKDFLETESGEYLVKQFKIKYPSANVTEIKMVDLVLWQTREGVHNSVSA